MRWSTSRGDTTRVPSSASPRSTSLLGEADARLGREHLRLETGDLGREGRPVDRHQQVALLHQRALAEVHRLDGAGDARAHVDALHRFQAAGELVPCQRLARLDHRDRYRHRRRCAAFAGASPACVVVEGSSTSSAAPARPAATMKPAVISRVRSDSVMIVLP